MRYQQRLWWLAFPLVLSGGCKKDDTNEPPTIEILSPGDGSTLVLPDTLTATVRASDDGHVEHVSITLEDADGIPVTPSVGASDPANGASVVLRLPVLSEQLESGVYTLVASATDGDGIEHAYRSVHVVAVPLRLRSVFVVTAVGSSTGVERVDSVGNVSHLTTLPMDPAGAAVSPQDQLLYLCGGVTGPLAALTPDDQQAVWEKPNLSVLGEPYFSALGLGGDVRPYVATSDGFLRGYNAATGMGEFNAAIPADFRGDQVLVMGEIVFCSMHHIATQAQRMLRYQHSSGAPDGDQLLDLAPVALFARSSSTLLLFGNSSGHGVVEERNTDLGGSWQPRTWTQAIVAAERISSDVWFVAFADGAIERFTYSTASSLAVAQLPGVRTLAFNEVNGAVYAGAGTQVVALSSATGQTVATYPMGNEVRYVLPLYNRRP